MGKSRFNRYNINKTVYRRSVLYRLSNSQTMNNSGGCCARAVAGTVNDGRLSESSKLAKMTCLCCKRNQKKGRLKLIKKTVPKSRMEMLGSSSKAKSKRVNTGVKCTVCKNSISGVDGESWIDLYARFTEQYP